MDRTAFSHRSSLGAMTYISVGGDANLCKSAVATRRVADMKKLLLSGIAALSVLMALRPAQAEEYDPMLSLWCRNHPNTVASECDEYKRWASNLQQALVQMLRPGMVLKCGDLELSAQDGKLYANRPTGTVNIARSEGKLYFGDEPCQLLQQKKL